MRLLGTELRYKQACLLQRFTFGSCELVEIPEKALLCLCLSALSISGGQLVLCHLGKAGQRYLRTSFPHIVSLERGSSQGPEGNLTRELSFCRNRGWLWISSRREGYLYDL